MATNQSAVPSGNSPLHPESIPAELKAIPRWLLWKLETRAGKPTKTPYQVSGALAKVNDPATWTTFENALTAYLRSGWSGIGIVLTEDDDLVGVDLDKVLDPDTGELAPEASRIVADLPTYCEISPSGRGLRLFGFGKLPQGGRRKGHVEMYEAGRYLTVTGNQFNGHGSLAEITPQLTQVHARIFGAGKAGAGSNPVDAKPDPMYPPNLDDADLLDKARRARNGADFERLWAGDASAHGGDESAADLALCNLLSFWTSNDAARIDRLFRQSGLMRPKWDKRHHADGRTYGQATIEKAISGNRETYSGREPDGKEPEEEPGKTTRRRKGKRPVSEGLAADLVIEAPKREGYICLRVGEYPEAVESAEEYLLAADVGIYQRGILCRVSRDPVPTVRGISRPAGVATIKEVTETWLLNQLDRRIKFEKWDGRSEDFKRCHAPKEIAQRLLHNAGSWKFPTLTGIITAPTLRPDGSILDQPGYDAATGLFFIQEQPFPTIPESPSKADGRAALDFILREVLAGFPFVEACHRSAALSAVLSVNVRHALRHTPLHAFTAPKAGSGKSLLADCVAMIGTGHPSAILALDDDQVEMNKAITAILMQGDAVVNLDNIERGEALSGRELSKALTQETYSGRILGSSKVVNLPSCCMWLATGNQLRISGDMTRRVIPCEIDPECERPDEREFKRDLYEWIPEHRPALVVAALTALRSYIVAGNPRQNIKPLGGFTDWSGLVRSALVWLGEEDPLSSRDSIEDADPERAKLRALLLAWQHTFGSAPTTSKEAIFKATPRIDPQTRDEIIDAPELREVLFEFFKDRNGNINSRLLGECISQNARRIESGARFEIAGTSHGAKLWKVVITHSDRFEKAVSVDSGELGELGELVPNPARKLSVPLGSPSGNIDSYIRRGAYENNSPDSPNYPPTQKTPTESPPRTAPTPPAAPSPGKTRLESPAARILARLHGVPAGVTDEDLKRTVCTEKGTSPALVDMALIRLVRDGEITKVNGRWVESRG